MDFEKHLPGEKERRIKALEGLIKGLEMFMSSVESPQPQTIKLYDKMLNKLDSLK